ncbi:unnamed protein product [Cercopithifilaria johnstoni]|uniref:Uncharacterized protein n=1 Tax=Cercopithifilaria johnstoni TaxID=2874296 RepID=A0A8J2LZT8_9BILA|nr:unnamed protein product [Cercopithifilaria johnstoni]
MTDNDQITGAPPASWRNGQRVGLRNRRLQVRLLPRSCRVGSTFLIRLGLLFSLFGMLNDLYISNKKYSRLRHENDILAQYENFSTFLSCKYHPPVEYDTSECGWASDETSFIVRYYRQRTHECASRLDMIPCNLKYPASYKYWQNIFKKLLNKNDIKSEYRPCPGIFNNTIGEYGMSPQTSILAPKIKNMDRFNIRFMLRPKDFIMRCPICMISSRFSS